MRDNCPDREPRMQFSLNMEEEYVHYNKMNTENKIEDNHAFP